jgi:hypothetical protein
MDPPANSLEESKQTNEIGSVERIETAEKKQESTEVVQDAKQNQKVNKSFQITKIKILTDFI